MFDYEIQGTRLTLFRNCKPILMIPYFSNKDLMTQIKKALNDNNMKLISDLYIIDKEGK